MLGIHVGHQGAHAGVVDILDLDCVHEPGELARQPGGLRRRASGCRQVGGDVGFQPAAGALGLGPSQHQLGERQMARDLADGGLDLASTARKLERAREQGSGPRPSR